MILLTVIAKAVAVFLLVGAIGGTGGAQAPNKFGERDGSPFANPQSGLALSPPRYPPLHTKIKNVF